MQKKAAGIRFTNVNQTAIFCAVPDILIQSVKMTRPQTKRRSGPRRRCLRRPLFCQHSQAAASAGSWPSGLDPTPTPTAALAHLSSWPFSHFGCGDFQVKNAATSKGFDWGAPGVGMEIFQLSNFYAKMSSGQRAEYTHTHTHSHLQKKYQKATQKIVIKTEIKGK